MILEMFTQLLDGIEVLHVNCNLSHLDLKLNNLLLDKDYKIKITDFGWARPNN